YVQVEASGEETSASKIVKIINESATYKSKVHNMGEKFADRMVLPTFALAAVGSTIGGPQAALAIINSDFGTGIRIAAPMAVLASLACAAKNGILIKNGRVLEVLPQVQAVLFDKTGTLTHEVPEVAKIIEASGDFKEEEILRFAAAAEQKFTHPIAKAILQKAAELGLELPPRDDSQMHVGFGIQVGIKGSQVKVGSIRYMEREKIEINEKVAAELTRIHQLGRSAILVAVDDKLAGAIELKASQRAEALEIMQALRKRGVKELVLISGDHEAAVREMASSLGMDRYFAEVLPQDKAKYVELLQKEGKKVAMVGDGINDSVALSKADVSISLRGASDIATDIADVVFMDGSLKKFDKLYEVSEMLRKNVNRSFKMILFPNMLCISGAMFGVVGLAASMVLNNGFNMVATINGMSPLFSVLEEGQKEQPKQEAHKVSEAIPVEAVAAVNKRKRFHNPQAIRFLLLSPP
ncbi:MAG: HAD-IC family P-type ATPase, partial [Deltaproteobacteria bacterium]|nr:HAD-IC family P-type ATPase [Deltaproteobacteria bacterium]